MISRSVVSSTAFLRSDRMCVQLISNCLLLGIRLEVDDIFEAIHVLLRMKMKRRKRCSCAVMGDMHTSAVIAVWDRDYERHSGIIPSLC